MSKFLAAGADLPTICVLITLGDGVLPANSPQGLMASTAQSTVVFVLNQCSSSELVWRVRTAAVRSCTFLLYRLSTCVIPSCSTSQPASPRLAAVVPRRFQRRSRHLPPRCAIGLSEAERRP